MYFFIVHWPVSIRFRQMRDPSSQGISLKSSDKSKTQKKKKRKSAECNWNGKLNIINQSTRAQENGIVDKTRARAKWSKKQSQDEERMLWEKDRDSNSTVTYSHSMLGDWLSLVRDLMQFVCAKPNYVVCHSSLEFHWRCRALFFPFVFVCAESVFFFWLFLQSTPT